VGFWGEKGRRGREGEGGYIVWRGRRPRSGGDGAGRWRRESQPREGGGRERGRWRFVWELFWWGGSTRWALALLFN
jgi:hypothetical protein